MKLLLDTTNRCTNADAALFSLQGRKRNFAARINFKHCVLLHLQLSHKLMMKTFWRFSYIVFFLLKNDFMASVFQNSEIAS